ncbi:MAG: hypothetical protein KGL95_11065, partial [Patescibacteria group bacterium]|nr:hypothetical protein [Patescibacteria group bacterium]
MNPVVNKKEHRPLLSFIKHPKFLGLLTLAFIVLIGLPVTLYEVSQQQNNQQRASFFINHEQYYYCNSAMGVYLDPGQETPDCTSGLTNTSSFKASFVIRAAPNTYGAYAIHYLWAQFWCPTAHAGGCALNGTGTPQTIGIEGSHGTQTAVTVYSDVRSPTPNFSGQACGTYQYDFAFYLTDNTNPNVPLCTAFNASN